jgi:hypothetical protein
VSDFEEHANHSVAAALEAIPLSIADDTYVVSLLVYDDEDDPRRPTLTVGTNSEAQVDATTPRASSPDEARWNFAYWLQDDLFSVGGWGDQDGVRLRRSWIEELGLWYSDEDEKRDFDAAMDVGTRITDQFVELAVRLAQRLHGQIAEQSERANPPGLTADFSRWVIGH